MMWGGYPEVRHKPILMSFGQVEDMMKAHLCCCIHALWAGPFDGPGYSRCGRISAGTHCVHFCGETNGNNAHFSSNTSDNKEQKHGKGKYSNC